MKNSGVNFIMCAFIANTRPWYTTTHRVHLLLLLLQSLTLRWSHVLTNH